jgi:hypothetical protein
MTNKKGAGEGANTRARNQPRVSANTKRDIDIDLGPKRGIDPREVGAGADKGKKPAG